MRVCVCVRKQGTPAEGVPDAYIIYLLTIILTAYFSPVWSDGASP